MKQFEYKYIVFTMDTTTDVAVKYPDEFKWYSKDDVFDIGDLFTKIGADGWQVAHLDFDRESGVYSALLMREKNPMDMLRNQLLNACSLPPGAFNYTSGKVTEP